MSTCKDECKHAVRCESWGEYKCKLYTRRMTSHNMPENCSDFVKKSADESASCWCNCEACMMSKPEED